MKYNISYVIKINKGIYAGQIVGFTIDIKELETWPLDSILVDKGYLECCTWSNEYTVLKRKID